MSGESSFTKQFTIDEGTLRHPSLPPVPTTSMPPAHADALQTMPTLANASFSKWFS